MSLLFLVLYPLGLRAELGVVAAVGGKGVVGVKWVGEKGRGSVHFEKVALWCFLGFLRGLLLWRWALLGVVAGGGALAFDFATFSRFHGSFIPRRACVLAFAASLARVGVVPGFCDLGGSFLVSLEHPTASGEDYTRFLPFDVVLKAAGALGAELAQFFDL